MDTNIQAISKGLQFSERDMSERTLPNPFETTKATDFTDKQILEYWVDLVGERRLEELLQPRSAMPIMVLGSKGCGKTHLLRYSAYSVRRLRWSVQPLEGIATDGYVGIYLSADGLNASRFVGKGIPNDRWAALFRYYFECWVTQLLIEMCEDVLHSQKAEPVAEARAVIDLLALFDRPPEIPETTLKGLKASLVAERKELDFAINNAAFTHTVEATIRVTPGRLLFDASDALAQLLGLTAEVKFLYLIDELENFNDDQQRFVNSLIRYRRGRTSFRIGARLYGIRTFETDNAKELNKEGAEYEVLHLDSLIRESDGYRQCARLLCAKRLVASGYVGSEHNIDALAAELDEFFEEPEKDALAVAETKQLIEKYEHDERPYLITLRKHLATFAQPALSPTAIDVILAQLACPDFPLLEKLNCLLLYQDWFRHGPLTESSEKIHRLMAQYRENPKKRGRYADTLSHFKSDLIAQLYRECKARPTYSGLESLIKMSGGVPRNLLGLLKHIVRRAAFNGESPFRKGKISLAAQRDGARDAASWFMEDAQPDQHGTDVRASINSVGELLREIRFSDKPVECAVSTVSLDQADLSETALYVLRHAVNWSFLLKVARGGKDKNSKAIIERFQLNPILAPRWDLSVSRRGTYALSADLANAIFDPSQRKFFADALRERVAQMNVPFEGADEWASQLPLGSLND